MNNITSAIAELFARFKKDDISAIHKIPQSGSNRSYFRIETAGGSYIAAYGTNIFENRAFIQLSRHFLKKKCPVPEILAVNADETIYIQEDFGDVSLLNRLEQSSYDASVYELFKKSLKALAHLQIAGDEEFNYDWCLTSKEFGKQAIVSDLLYFKYYFLDTLQIPYDKEKLIGDFDALASYLAHADHKFFMYRDFQSRNILIKEDKPCFIDYQGGMKGALQYDVASLLWQAKAELPDEWKNKLLDYYMDCVEELLKKSIDRNRFAIEYNGYVLIRLLQVLGAYGFRGLFERKAHFLISIPLALRNLKWFLENRQIGISLPEFDRLLQLTVEDKMILRFEPVRANEQTPLIVHINSFSYRKGIPIDTGDNGGGFVFDCRSILNPGRLDAFKSQTGRDRAVKEFLEQETKMPDFLNSVYDLVDIAVEDYIKRGFSSLMINFGCTGGQHRSVYAADAVARHLKNKFGVRIELKHLVQDAKNWIN